VQDAQQTRGEKKQQTGVTDIPENQKKNTGNQHPLSLL